MHKLAKINTPVFWAEGHPGALDRENWKLEICGLCENPVKLSWQDLQEFQVETVNARLTSVTRWSVYGAWTGVRIANLLDHAKILSGCRYLRFWSVGDVYDTSIPLAIGQKERSLVAWAFDGELLDENYGGPIRAFIPYLWGYKSAKSIIRIELMDHYIPGFWEIRGYTDSGEIEAGVCRDINDDGALKHIPGGEVIEFS
ncbi:MAG: molybdopterin-dependent oxidoreductase [Candidatus Cloacimonetes bacterium]|jgi:DMSO/TMAO reductase YedYZ molybdopterin-dependent catalytic subunit|nr:molybdopterin-dependent oxidoreductase [Candidatus Cloacimonadota bacterium]MDD2505837.1 molybdopterin-dependent oxidoreductase [Candidatus Cloacimonadota bacterium]MDD4147049.1 molybdopterin-dependent oxidoreductase [Candidatus Cloacimonadota bacterium]MDD4559466.1 molybdopterin-dependent oxidoreductase [Candidatus Cloacimonadota bacterium]